MSLGVGEGVAIRELQEASDPLDYALFVECKLYGVTGSYPEGK